MKLDKKDLKILQELDKDARQPLSRIARKAGMSKEVVAYRLKQMQKRKVTEGFYTIIDVAKLGYMIHRIMIRFQNVGVEKEREIISYLKAKKSVGWIVSVQGNWDLAVLFWARNVLDFRKDYDELMERYGHYFQNRRLTIITKIRHYRNNYLFGTMDISERVLGGLAKVSIDRTDRKILEALSRDCRKPTVEIAQSVGVAPNTVKNRIKRLEKTGVIQGYRVKINTSGLEYDHYKVFLLLDNPGLRDRIIHYLAKEPRVVYVTEAIGKFDLEFEMMAQTAAEMNEFLRGLRMEFSDMVKEYESELTYKEHQINYLP